MCYVRKTKLLMELWYNKLHALIHISNKEAEYQYPGQRTSMSEKFRRRFLRDRDNGNGPWRIKNFPSVESEGHNTLEERTVSTDRHAKETSVRQKRAEVFRKLQVSSQEIRLNKKSEPNWEVFFFFFSLPKLRSLLFHAEKLGLSPCSVVSSRDMACFNLHFR